MALSFSANKRRVRIGGLGSVNSSGTVELNGAVQFGIVDISAYVTNGVTLYAHEFGLTEIHGLVLQMNELDEAAIFTSAINSNRKSAVVSVWDAATPTEHAQTDVGECAFIVWGESLGEV